MALRECPNCKEKISEYASKCPKCGWEISIRMENISHNEMKEKVVKPEKNGIKVLVGMLVVVFIVIVVVVLGNRSNNIPTKNDEIIASQDQITNPIQSSTEYVPRSVIVEVNGDFNNDIKADMKIILEDYGMDPIVGEVIYRPRAYLTIYNVVPNKDMEIDTLDLSDWECETWNWNGGNVYTLTRKPSELSTFTTLSSYKELMSRKKGETDSFIITLKGNRTFNGQGFEWEDFGEIKVLVNW